MTPLRTRNDLKPLILQIGKYCLGTTITARYVRCRRISQYESTRECVNVHFRRLACGLRDLSLANNSSSAP